MPAASKILHKSDPEIEQERVVAPPTQRRTLGHMLEPTKQEYHLWVKMDPKADWQLLETIEAKTHPEGFRKAMLCLKPEHYDKPIRFEQNVIGVTRKEVN